MRTNAELLLALLDEDELEEMHRPLTPKEKETAFCCGGLIDDYTEPCPHCQGDPKPF